MTEDRTRQTEITASETRPRHRDQSEEAIESEPYDLSSESRSKPTDTNHTASTVTETDLVDATPAIASVDTEPTLDPIAPTSGTQIWSITTPSINTISETKSDIESVQVTTTIDTPDSVAAIQTPSISTSSPLEPISSQLVTAVPSEPQSGEVIDLSGMVSDSKPRRPRTVDTTLPSAQHRNRRRSPQLRTMSETPDTPDSTDLATTHSAPDSYTGGDTNRGSGGTAKRPDPVELLLDIDGSSLPVREPIVLCLDAAVSSEYLGIVETIAKRLYRERVGGTPTPLRLTDLDELTKETRWIEADGNLTTIALSEADWNALETEYERTWRRLWEDRIQNQLFAQEFGIIILNQRVTSPPGDHYPRIYQINPAMPPADVQHKVAGLASGFTDTDAGGSDDCTFAQRFNGWQEQRQRETWQQLEARQNGLFWDTTNSDAAESRLHRRLKVFAVQALATQLDLDLAAVDTPRELRQYIQTERTMSPDSAAPIRPDIYCDALPSGRTVAVEAETLFATARDGGSPRDKLRQTITKYQGAGTVDDLVILVDPLTAVTQSKMMTSVAKTIEARREIPTVSFAGVNFTTGRFRSVSSLYRAWQRLLGDAEPDSQMRAAVRLSERSSTVTFIDG